MDETEKKSRKAWKKLKTMTDQGVDDMKAVATLAAEFAETAVGEALEAVERALQEGRGLAESLRENPVFQQHVGGAPQGAGGALKEWLAKAREARATDVHFEPEEDGYRLRFRIDGVLKEQGRFPQDAGRRAIRRIVDMAGLDPAETYLPQDGGFILSDDPEATGEGRDLGDGGPGLHIRVCLTPSPRGYAAMLRLVDPRAEAAVLEDIDRILTDAVRGDVLEDLARPHGMIVVTGPSGSGKTTTSHALLAQHVDEGVKVIAAVDPVCYDIPGVQAIPVRPSKGLNYSAALRAALRMDADVLYCGELRDYESVRIVMQAALTGRRVIVEMHANSAIDAIARLLNIGLETYLLADALNGVVSQRLVRKLIPDRSRAAPEDEAAVRGMLGDTAADELDVRVPEDPEAWRGRAAVQEYLRITQEMRTALATGGLDALRDTAARQGFRTLQEQGAALVAAGRTSLGELRRVCGPA
jgi:general secretion pathway protein E